MQPFIIWTQRRTGGTTLTSLLVECSGLPAWQDEALNDDRELGSISRAWGETGDRAALAARIAVVVEERKILKHSLDTVAWPVSRALLNASTAAGYRHVLLLRRNETERQLSLALAELTGAWGPHDAPARYRELAEGRLTLPPIDIAALRDQVHLEAGRLGRLIRALLAGRTPHAILFYEDLFSGSLAERRQQFDVLARFLGLDQAAAAPLLEEALMGRAQNTRAVYHFLPNLAEVVEAIEEMT